MKKILSLTLAAVLLLSLFGCAVQESPPPTMPSTMPAATGTTGAAETTVPPETTVSQTDPPETTGSTEPSEVTNSTKPTEATAETKPTEPEKPKENTGKQEETKPKDPPATEPTQPATEPTDPPSTKPAETTPPETQPPETEPVETTDSTTYEITWEFKHQVAQYAIQYLNQYRSEAGVHPCTYLSGMTQVAQYRASQLTWSFSHSTADKREALAYYQYGRYIDATLAGLSESDSYYEADSAEAICGGFRGFDAEELGAAIARMIHNSSSHWSYIGNSEYSYIGVGVEYREDSQYGWYACVMVGKVNHG